MMTVKIARTLLEKLVKAAAETPDVEICGLLFGWSDCVEGSALTKNVAVNPANAFEIDPAALIAAYRDEREGGPKLIGCFHSHPNLCASPSPQDCAQMENNGWLWLIVAGENVHGWRASGPLMFDPITLNVV